MKTTAALILSLCAALAACGGGGEDSGPAAPVTIVDATVTKTRVLVGKTTALQETVDAPAFTLSGGPGQVAVCADVTWVQTTMLASPLTLRTTLRNFGRDVEAVSASLASAPAGDSAMTFKRCAFSDTAGGETFSRRPTMYFDLRAQTPTAPGSNGNADILGGYVVTVRWTVTAPK